MLGDDRLPDVTPARPPEKVARPSNIQHWDDISFLHWPIEPARVQRLLPEGIEVDVFDGAAWLGVTPFSMRVRALRLRSQISRFPETNVRTYVRGPDGRPGLFFFHLEVGSTWFTGLRLLGLPYVRRHMATDRTGEVLTYLSRRRRTGSEGYEIRVRPDGPATATLNDDPRVRFLTARWRAFHVAGTFMLATQVEHPPWTLSSARAEHRGLEVLWDATGVPRPETAPLVHYSPGVEARLGWPKAVA